MLVSLVYEDFFVSKRELLQFVEDIERTIYYNDKLLVMKDSLPEGAAGRLEQYTASEIRRRNILRAVVDDDMHKAQKLLVNAMDIAIAEAKENSN